MGKVKSGFSVVCIVLMMFFGTLGVAAGAEWCDTDPPIAATVKGTDAVMNVHVLVRDGNQAAVEQATYTTRVNGNHFNVTVGNMSVEYKVYAVMDNGAVITDDTVYQPGQSATLTYKVKKNY